MAETSTIQYLSMEPADNGIIVSWSEKIEKSNKGTYDNCSYKDHKLVFDDLMEGGDGFEQAFAKYKELWKKKYDDLKK